MVEQRITLEQGITLGHIVSQDGIKVDSVKIDVISSLSYLVCVQDIRSFLGHAGFYRHFMGDFNRIVVPLFLLL